MRKQYRKSSAVSSSTMADTLRRWHLQYVLYFTTGCFYFQSCVQCRWLFIALPNVYGNAPMHHKHRKDVTVQGACSWLRTIGTFSCKTLNEMTWLVCNSTYTFLFQRYIRMLIDSYFDHQITSSSWHRVHRIHVVINVLLWNADSFTIIPIQWETLDCQR